MKADTGVRSRMKAERPGQILEAAFDEFVDKGFAAARVEDIARAVGVTKGTVYVYFKDKQALLEAVIKHALDPECQELPEPADLDGKSPREQLRYFLETFYACVAADDNAKKLFRLLLQEGRHQPDLIERHYELIFSPFDELLGQILRNGVDAGVFRKLAEPAGGRVILGPAILAMIWTMLFNESRHFDIDHYIDVHLDLLLNGLLQR